MQVHEFVRQFRQGFVQRASQLVLIVTGCGDQAALAQQGDPGLAVKQRLADLGDGLLQSGQVEIGSGHPGELAIIQNGDNEAGHQLGVAFLDFVLVRLHDARGLRLKGAQVPLAVADTEFVAGLQVLERCVFRAVKHHVAVRSPVVIDLQGAVVAAVFFNTAGKIPILTIVGVRLEMGVNRAQAGLFLQNGADGLLHVPAADPARTVGLDIARDNIAHHLGRAISRGKLTADQLAVLACGRTQLVHNNALHRVPGFRRQPVLHTGK